MVDLKPFFIAPVGEFKEGAVVEFGQRIAPVRPGERAMLTITALGMVEAAIDGKKLGDALFAPGYTYYPARVNAQTFDVTDLLAHGGTITVQLAQGWYCGRYTFKNRCQIYGERPAVSWVLTVGDAVYTSRGEDVTCTGSFYEYAGLYDGEVYDADRTLLPVRHEPYTGPLPDEISETILSVKLHEEIKPVAVTKHDGFTIVDFGQNFAGVVCIDPQYMDGDTLTLRHGEILNPDGTLYTANLRKAKATTVYADRHKNGGVYRPRFTYMGFRYVELTGVPYKPGLLRAYAVYSDMARTGEFACDNPLVDRLYNNQVWGQKSNYVEVPTDCPQRDERQGYTGDGHVFARTGAYNFDTELFWKKFLQDIRDSQAANTEGYVAPTIPAEGPAGIGFMSMLGWGNCVTIVPEMLFEMYGTDEHLRAQYDSMKTFVECELRHAGEGGLWMAPSLGDWLMLGKDTAWMAMHHGPVSNAFIVNDLRIMTETAHRFGFADDEARYAGELERVRNAYIKAFVLDDGSMRDDYQGAYIMALRFVIPRGELWDKVYRKLIENIRAHGMQTGFFSTEHILPLLRENGDAGLALHLLLQEHCPGWMYQVKRGATTTWERWDSLRPDGTVNEDSMSDDNMVSFNHYAFGSVGRFLYEHILGIQPAEPGFARVRLVPLACRELGGASGSFKSRHGVIKSVWKVDGDIVRYEIDTPVAGDITLADGTTHALTPGHHSFTCSADFLPVVESLDYDSMTRDEPAKPAAPAPAPKKKPARSGLSSESTVGDILADPRGKAIIDELLPGVSTNEQLKAAYGMTFPRLAGMMHLPENVVSVLVERLDALSKPALSSESTVGDILADPRGRAIIDELLPGVSTNEQLKAAYGMTFPRLAGMMHLPENVVSLLVERLDALG